MAHKVKLCEIPELLKALDQYKLDCFSTYKLIENSHKTNGTYPRVEIFVDNEDISKLTSVVAVWYQDFPPIERWYFAFTTDTDSLKILISRPGVFQVDKHALNRLACEKSAIQIFYDLVTKEMGLQTTEVFPMCIYTNDNLEIIDGHSKKDIPEGFTIGPLQTIHADRVRAAWEPGYALERFECLTKYYSSLAIYNNQGTPVSWVFVKEYGDIGMTYTAPGYRRRGFASILTAKMAKILLERKEIPFIKIVSPNTISTEMHTKLGFKRCGDLTWYYF